MTHRRKRLARLLRRVDGAKMTRAESARVARSIPRSGRRSLRVVIGYERIMEEFF